MDYLEIVYDKTIRPSWPIVDIFNKRSFNCKQYKSFLQSLHMIDEDYHLAEIPSDTSPVLVDVDISEKLEDGDDNIRPLYDEETVEEIINSYTDVLDEYLTEKPDSYKILLLEKDPRITHKNNDRIIKHGFHLHFVSISMKIEELKIVYNKVKEISEFGDYLDNVSTKSWLLYGASKSPEDKPYLISKAFVMEHHVLSQVDFESLFLGEKICDIVITSDNLNELLPFLLSIRTNPMIFSGQTHHELKKIGKLIDETNYNDNPDWFEDSDSDSGLYEEDSVDGITEHQTQYIIQNLKEERSDDFMCWIKICMILVNMAQKQPESVEFYKGLFHIFSRKSDKYDECTCDRKWEEIFKRSNYNIGMGTLKFMAREDGIDLKNINQDRTHTSSDIPTHDYDIAMKVKESINKIYITHKEHGCYVFDDTVWIEVSGWDSIFKNHIKSWYTPFKEELDRTIKYLEDLDKDSDGGSSNVDDIKKLSAVLERKIKNYSSLNNITKSLFDLYFDPKTDSLFDQKEGLIAFKNRVLDLENWCIIDGSPNHYLSTRIEHDLIDWEYVPEKNRIFVDDFWSKIFPDKELRKYCIKNFARILTGKNSFKQFQFWTGTGNNGKSVCINLMEQIFGRMTMKVPKSLVTGVVQKQGSASPELYRLKDARLAIIDEVTNNDFLDPGQIKGLTGNDKLYGRDLYQRSKSIREITPMFFPILITNETPIIKRPDDATWSRIRLIPFESKFKYQRDEYIRDHPEEDSTKIFPSDPKIYDMLRDNAKFFLSQFCHELFKYPTFDQFNNTEILPKKVIKGLDKFKEGQNILKQFIQENFVVDPNSTEILSSNKMLRDYHNTRPKVTLSLEELEAAVINYSKTNPGVTVVNNNIRGLVRVEY